MGALATINEGYSREQIDLIKQTVARDATELELKLFLHQCQRAGLDPLTRQIFCVHRFNTKTNKKDMTIQTSIDGYRLIADRTGQYAGNDDYEFDDPEGQPKWAKSTVYKLVGGIRCPFSATARWSQYYPGEKQGFMWGKMPHVMLGKCAEALALRKAFPAEMSGVYTREEMDQADRDTTIQSEAIITAEKYGIEPAKIGTKEAAQLVAQSKLIELKSGAQQLISPSYRPSDLEDVNKPPLAQQTKTMMEAKDNTLSPQQVQLFWTTASKQKFSKEGAHEMLKADFGVSSVKDLKKTQFDAAIAKLERKPEVTTVVIPAPITDDAWTVSAVASFPDYANVTLLSEDGKRVTNAYCDADLYLPICEAKESKSLLLIVFETTKSEGAHKGRPIHKIVEFKVVPF